MTRTAKIYLAGPIAGLSYGKANSWREGIINEGHTIGVFNVDWVNPLEPQKHLSESDKPLTEYGHDEAQIFQNARNAVLYCDLILVNLLGATKVSQGTITEIAWAYHLNKPMQVAIEPKGNIHDTMFLRQMLMRGHSGRWDGLSALLYKARSFADAFQQ